jgi:hypothetical protein
MAATGQKADPAERFKVTSVEWRGHLKEVRVRPGPAPFLLPRSACVSTIEDLSRMYNPVICGWLQYYGRFYRSALYPPMRQLDRSLARWAYRKYKKLRGHLRRATHWVARISRRDPKLWAHWQMGVRRGSMAGAV